MKKTNKYHQPNLGQTTDSNLPATPLRWPQLKPVGREFEVFLLLSAGESVDAICKKLNMSSRTVFNYQTTIRKKMNLHTHIEFNRYAIQRGLIPDTVNSY